jgi:hypothetical protein
MKREALFFKFAGGGNTAPSLQSYPYVAQRTPMCMSSVGMPSVALGITEVKDLELKANEEELKSLVASEGPVGIAIDATSNFKLYKSGVFTDPTADNTCQSVNHAVVSRQKREKRRKLILISFRCWLVTE